MPKVADSDLMGSVDPGEFLKITPGGRWYYKGELMRPEDIGALKEEAKAFLQSNLWKVIQAEADYFAFDAIVNKAVNDSDILAARTVVYWSRKVIEPKLKEMAT